MITLKSNDHLRQLKIFVYFRLSRSFWLRFDAKHSSLTIKRQGNVSINRALNCTREMACEHLDNLAKELIDAGIMTNAEQDDNGIWRGDIDTSRIFNCDETPQFIIMEWMALAVAWFMLEEEIAVRR